MPPYRRREAAPLIRDALEALPVVVLTGLRGTGKSTLLTQAPELRGRRYVDLDDPAVLEIARTEPQTLIEGEEPLSLDEAQRAPKLLTAIRHDVRQRPIPGRYLLAGSSNPTRLQTMCERLAEKVFALTLYPLSRRERLEKTSEEPFLLRFFEQPAAPRVFGIETVSDAEIGAGGLPALALEDASWDDWFTDFQRAFFDHEVPALSRITDTDLFGHLLRFLPQRTGEPLNHSELARLLDLPLSTILRYLAVVEGALLVESVPPFLRSAALRIAKSPRMFMADSGLAAHLLLSANAENDVEIFRQPLLKTYVLRNLQSILGARLPRSEIGFWTIQARRKVDFLISRGRNCLALDVTASTRVRESDLLGLRACLAQTTEVGAAVLGYNGTEAVEIQSGLYAVPLGLLLS